MAGPAILQDGPDRGQGRGVLQVCALLLGAARTGGSHRKRHGALALLGLGTMFSSDLFFVKLQP